MLCMARCSSQSTVLTSWVSHWPQTPPGRHINITNKASRTLGSGKNPEDRLLFSKRQGLQVQGSCHTCPGICKLYLAPKQHQADQPPRVCTAKGSMVDTTETLGWPYLQHRCRKARLVNTRWLPVSQEPIIPIPCYTCQVLYWLQEVLLFPQCNQGLKWPLWGCCCCTHPWDFLFTSSKISTFGVGHAPK